MSSRWILVDGYSVVHNWPQLQRLAGRSLQRQRQTLVKVLGQYADHSRRRVTVVFDGYAAKFKPDTADGDQGVEILFSESGKTADDVIERLVAQAPTPGEILVVTSDNQERRTVESMGAQSVSTELFGMEVQVELKELERLVRRHGRSSSLGSVRDEFDR